MFKKSAFLLTTLIVLSSSLQAQTVIAKYAGEFMALGVEIPSRPSPWARRPEMADVR